MATATAAAAAGSATAPHRTRQPATVVGAGIDGAAGTAGASSACSPDDNDFSAALGLGGELSAYTLLSAGGCSTQSAKPNGGRLVNGGENLDDDDDDDDDEVGDDDGGPFFDHFSTTSGLETADRVTRAYVPTVAAEELERRRLQRQWSAYGVVSTTESVKYPMTYNNGGSSVASFQQAGSGGMAGLLIHGANSCEELNSRRITHV